MKRMPYWLGGFEFGVLGFCALRFCMVRKGARPFGFELCMWLMIFDVRLTGCFDCVMMVSG